MPRAADDPTRFGFIVSKAVGNAVTRNRVRRRLKAIAADLLHEQSAGIDAVVRALPAAAQADWPTLSADVTRSFGKANRSPGAVGSPQTDMGVRKA